MNKSNMAAITIIETGNIQNPLAVGAKKKKLSISNFSWISEIPQDQT